MADEWDTAAFEQLVADAMDALPAWLAPYLDGVAIQVAEAPPAGDRDLYGLYEGIPLGEDATGVLPPIITVFRRTLVHDFGHDPDVLRREVQITIAHELAHHFGFDERRLDELGYA